MPSLRRMRLVFVAVLAGVVLTLMYTSRLRNATDVDGTPQDFYHKTVSAMGKKLPGQTVMGSKDGRVPADKDADGDVDADDERVAQEMAERLRAAEQKAKDLANQKAPLKPDNPSVVVGVGSSAEGQEKKIKLEDGKPSSGVKTRPAETAEEHEVETELNSILKKSPVIIFSKTYCPFSKKAKALLLEKYVIEPTPYVVELDIHPLGPRLQSLLAEKTGRKTVPNIMVNGVSIGGSDDIAELESQKLLVPKIKDLGETRKVDMKERLAAG